MVPGGHYLRDAVWIPPLLLQAPQPDDPQGHEEKDHDGELRIPRGRVEPDLRNGKRHCEKVSLWRKLCARVKELECFDVKELEKHLEVPYPRDCFSSSEGIVCSSSS